MILSLEKSAQFESRTAFKKHPHLLARKVSDELRRRIRLYSPNGACEYLELNPELYEARTDAAFTIIECFQKLFPRKFKYSLRAAFSPDMEQDFYRYVNHKFFPIDLDKVCDPHTWIFPYIPIQSMQKQDWLDPNWTFEELPLVFQVALSVSHQWNQEQFTARLIQLHNLPKISTVDRFGVENKAALVDSCKLQKSPVRYFPLALGFINYASGNIWIDSHPRIIHYALMWSEENVLNLAKEWKNARRFFNLIELFDAWLSQKPKERILECIRIWNGAENNINEQTT